MESKTPVVDAKIFFKDEQNELKGPYTEGRVQEWYRQRWFDSSFPFYFMKGDERPTDHTEFLTLGTLRKLNGIDYPFASKKPESNNEKSEENVAKLEKELAVLLKKCDKVDNLEKQVENLQKELKELSTQPPPTSSSSAAAAAPASTKAAAASTTANKPEKQPEENSEHVKVANAWAAYYLDVLEAYKTGKWDKVDGEKFRKIIASLSAIIFADVTFRQKCQDVLLKKLMELDHVYCKECDSVFHNFKQILMHAVSSAHHQDYDALHMLQKVVNMQLVELCRPVYQSLIDSEQEHVKLVYKYSNIHPSTPDLRPLIGFVDQFTVAYGEAVCDYAGNLNSNRAQLVAKMISRLKQNDTLGRKMLSELHEHIGGAQTRCNECNVPTGTRDEYYRHLRSLAHQSKSNAMDLITLVVNLYQKN